MIYFYTENINTKILSSKLNTYDYVYQVPLLYNNLQINNLKELN